MAESKGVRVEVIDRQGQLHHIDARAQEKNIMQALFDAGQDIEAVCGGCCSCATCHVYVDTQWLPLLPARSENETMLLEYSQHYDERRSRLSCQIPLSAELDGIGVELAPQD